MLYNLLGGDQVIRLLTTDEFDSALLGHEKVLEWMLQSNKYCDINESTTMVIQR
jgi:hypothetical protein